jgi:hypothetical protein
VECDGVADGKATAVVGSAAHLNSVIKYVTKAGCELGTESTAVSKAKTLDPGLRRDDDFEANHSSNVIPAQAGIQRLSLFID